MMRILTAVFFLAVLVSCSKDKFTKEPQIEFKGFTTNQAFSNILSTDVPPYVKLSVTDGDGDLGSEAGRGTAFIYLKNLLTGAEDSLPFPNLESAARKNFKADLEVSLFDIIGPTNNPLPPPYIDTLFFEIFVRDINRNKSNVIVTSEPFFLFTP